jgi:nucleoside-diphosphate-sugar epimerase
MAKVLIVGCGYVGEALARNLVADGHQVHGLRRSAGELPKGVRLVRADVTRPESLTSLPGGLDFVVYAVAAKQRDEAVYRAVYLDGLGNILRALADLGQRPRRLFFTSSTSVYGQRRGEWVDETSPTHPAGFAGEIVLSAERLLAASRIPGTSLRLGGLYGPGRTRLIERVRRGEARLRPGEAHYTNRIHRDDAATAIQHLLGLAEPAPTYVCVDSEPADEAEVLRWLAAQLGAPDPPQSPASEQEESQPTVSRRCRNALLLAAGYRFRYPTFREGYAALLGSGSGPERRGVGGRG